MNSIQTTKMTNYRWIICAMLFFATTVNYMDRQVLSLTWKDFIAPEFDWNDDSYGTITAYFSIFYAIIMLFAGKVVDMLGTRKGYLWAIGIWSTGAILHAFCGIATSGIVSGHWLVGFEGAKEHIAAAVNAGTHLGLMVSTISVWLFLVCRMVLATGEAGNFPAAIKVTAEYFPKKDRAFATAIFNNGASVGALIAPLTIPLLARYFGWEMSFIVIGALGYIWMIFWIFVYVKPAQNKKMNAAELTYINQDADTKDDPKDVHDEGPKIGFGKCFTYRQTWAFIVGKFMTDGVWWFFLFWTPAYISDVYGYSSDSPMGMSLIFVLYLITMLSIAGGYLPTYFVNKRGMNPYAGRMRAMLIFAFFPLFGMLAQPMGTISPWMPVILIGILGAAHQSWSANIFSTVSDMFPKSAVATVTGIGGMAGGVGSFLINKGSGMLFTYADGQGAAFSFMGFEGKPAGYMIIFCICAVAYLIGWTVMKVLVPKYKPIIA